MGIVIKQSGWNLVITGLGFVLGALNVLLLAQVYLSDDYYGLWNYVLSVAFLFFPLMSFGMHNTIVKFFSSFQTREDKDSFLTQMLILPLFIIIPVLIILYFFQDDAIEYISQENKLTGNYLWCIPLIAIFQAYFEIFYAWVKVHMKTIMGNFMKEVFYRAAAAIALLLVVFHIITQEQFIYSLVIIYALRLLIMMFIALHTYFPIFKWNNLSIKSEIMQYSFYMIIAGSISTALIDLDKFMLNQYIDLDTIGYYGIAIFIATVIAVPARGMAQITHPLTAGYINRGELDNVEQLYKRSSLNLTIVSGFLLVIIIGNLQEFYQLLQPETRVAIPVVFIIAVVKFSENILGTNNAILYNSGLYKATMWFGLALVIVAMILNTLLIPRYGIIGAAIATCIAYMCYAFAKAYYLYHKYKIHPWTLKTWLSILVILLCAVSFYFWDFSWHPVLNIALKSILISLAYLMLVYRLNLSTEITGMIKKWVR